MERLDLLARIGAAGDGGGITRPGLSADEDEAHALLAGWCEEAGLAVSRDAVGNLYARPRRAAAGAEIWSGSHLDTVPSGGRFDGALGVVAALEAVADVAADRPEARLPSSPSATRRGGGSATGSSAAAASRATSAPTVSPSATPPASRSPRRSPHSGFAGPPVDAALPSAYVEVHIEQGPILDAADAPLGDVAAIAGMANFTVTFRGASGHAGTVPMSRAQ